MGLAKLENHPKYATFAARQENAAQLIKIIEDITLTKTYAEWMELPGKHKPVWSPVCTALELTRDEQAIANDLFGELDLPEHGRIKVLNNPIKLCKTPAGIQCKASELGEPTADCRPSWDINPRMF